MIKILVGHWDHFFVLIPTIALSPGDGGYVIAIHYLCWYIAFAIKRRRRKNHE